MDQEKRLKIAKGLRDRMNEFLKNEQEAAEELISCIESDSMNWETKGELLKEVNLPFSRFHYLLDAVCTELSNKKKNMLTQPTVL